MINQEFKKERGFTLIEVIVVIAVFLFIIGAAVGIFISIIENQKKILAEQQFLNQISYIEEYMSKALRMAKTAGATDCIPEGYIYELTQLKGGYYQGIKFMNQINSINGICQEFYLDTDGVLKESKNNADAMPLTSDSMKINFVRFSINGSDGSVSGLTCDIGHCGASNIDGIQPRATILLNVKIPGDNKEPDRTIQTTVSRRNLNVKQ
ncbi:MAG: type II secretion system protein [Candidatus Staskawiczbacteria bacterium]|nr:type II secretion system protein [Candidatus Staskawiczbacteria bacterium]